MVGGFGKTQARVDEYFALKKIEANWASERARPAGLDDPRLAGLGPFRFHLSRAASSPYSSS